MSKPIPLVPGEYYHIFNRGNNRENLFREERNYHHFLKLYQKHITPVVETFAYCLLKNHFHLLVRIREQPDLTGFENLSGLNWEKPHLAFSRLFNAYTKAFNKAYERTGSLFERPFKRILITEQAHLLHLTAYIHQNPQKHGFVDDFRDWPFTSYQALTTTRPTFLNRHDVHNWFENSQGLVRFHETPITPLDIEDFD